VEGSREVPADDPYDVRLRHKPHAGIVADLVVNISVPATAAELGIAGRQTRVESAVEGIVSVVTQDEIAVCGRHVDAGIAGRLGA
jgi:hypothetical protein